ncbi:target of EGR1 protein 1 [Lampris incognitus]|uniref:target of EGR1 protein 1 n=1 Tax=Lampris incognitus TaxID=2546036 RepID=UPI0024B579FB|nr:target of EGR1 protein 1 [Lampris incognitus]
MTSSMVVPVIDVQNDNFKELWAAMVLAIKASSFIALDTELSGLGNRKSLLAECIEDRYKAICHAARSRSILSLGIACYKKLDNETADTYLVQVYNLTLLCSEEYIIEPQSVQFLVQHGFDFNKQYAQGVPYVKGNNKGGADNQGISIRALFTELLRARKPLVLHNGLIDIAFLYQCFYAHLPERLATFTADLSEMFPAGVYDTKYVTEFELRLTASYLEYAYKKCKLDNSRNMASAGTGPHLHVEFCQYTGQMCSYVDYRVCPAVAFPDVQPDICQRFSAFGWCPNGSRCSLSHNTDLIIFEDEKGKEDKRKRRKRKREKKRGKGEETEGSCCLEGAPENKIAHIELDSKEPAKDQNQGVTPKPLPESGSGAKSASCPHQTTKSLPVTMPEERNNVSPFRTDSGMISQPTDEGNGVCEDDTVPKTSATTTTDRDTAEITAVNKSDDSERTTGGGRETSSKDSAKTEAQRKKLEAGTHRAGFDAFMTGYIYAYASALTRREGSEDKRKREEKQEDLWLPTCLNKVYLSGKAVPLNIVKSSFAKSSKAHIQKMEMVWGKSLASTLMDRM